jgi:hypothetical protein
MTHLKSLLLIGIFTLFFSSQVFAQQTGSLNGQVVDSSGAAIVGATVTTVDASGKIKTAISNQRGEFSVAGLAPGTYTVRAIAPQFGLYENAEVQIAAGGRQELTIALSIAEVTEEVQVSTENQVSTDPESNASATVLKEKDLEALPDDPDELEAALQALAGPSAGPNGGQIYIDGFTGGRLPPRESIREIRINQNPFSAEYERLGFGRIEVLTKPGADRFRGQAFFIFGDESLNSRNPFSVNRAPSQRRNFGGNVSGPVQKGKSSFFFDISHRSDDSNDVINALILDPSFNIVPFRQEFQIPTRRFSVSPRFDYQINTNNTLVARYNFSKNSFENQGIGDTRLESVGSEETRTNHDFQLTETAIINPKTINETRFRYEVDNRDQQGDNSIPTINVSAAFTGGGSQIGLSYNCVRNWELQNYTTTTLGASSQHSVKFGVRMRGTNIENRSENNFGGAFTFPGAAAVRNPDRPNCLSEETGCIISSAITPLDQFRGNVLGNPDARFNPTQFRITTGDPLADVSRFDFGGFVTDDWRISPKLTLGFGLRYENQTNISDKMNFAPRLNFAYSPGAGGARAPKTVFRGGAGIFYDRFSENFTLRAERFDGTRQLELVVSANDPNPARRQAALALLNQPVFTSSGVTNVPTAAQILAVLPQSNTIQLVSPELQSPYTMQAALSVERQLRQGTTLSMFYVASRTLHLLRSRNINAPFCPTGLNCNNAPRPDPTRGAINQYESSGVFNQQQLITSLRTTINPRVTLNVNYRLGFAKGDSDGAGSFPAYSYDLSNEYGNSFQDIRHNLTVFGNITLPWRVSLNPFIIASSGRPFNITNGIDANGDLQFTERPTFAALNARCTALALSYSFCDIGGISDPNAIIPRNYARGPAFFIVNLRMNKSFGFGKSRNAVVAVAQGASAPAEGGGRNRGAGGGGRGAAAGGGGRRGGGGPGGAGGGGFGGGQGGFGGGGNDKPYNLNVGINVNNLFNNVNFNPPIGSLNSSRFGQFTSLARGFGGFGGGGGGSGNRNIELSLRFNF